MEKVKLSVSIPLRYDPNMNRTNSTSTATIAFQFLLGTIQTV